MPHLYHKRTFKSRYSAIVSPAMSASSSADVSVAHGKAEEIPMEGPKGVDVLVAEPDSSDEESFTKNTRGTSSWTIFASALANFSDGYQNNLVGLALNPNLLYCNRLTPDRLQARMLSSSICMPRPIHLQCRPVYQMLFSLEQSLASSFSDMPATCGRAKVACGSPLDWL